MLLVFWLDISGVAVQEIYKTAKMIGCRKYFLCGDDFDAALAIFRSYCYSDGSLKQLKRLMQMKKIITNAPCALLLSQIIIRIIK